MIGGLLRVAGALVGGTVFSFIGYHIGQELQGAPVAPLALAVGLMAVGGAWWWRHKQR